MQRDVAALRDLAHRCDRVDDAARVLGRRAEDHHGVAVDQAFELAHIGAEVLGQRQRSFTPKYSEALNHATCALCGTIISGFVTRRVARARSR